MNQKLRITRSPENRVVAGVCGGIADYFGWRPSRVRIAYALVSLFSAAFPGVLVYLVLWYLIPERRP